MSGVVVVVALAGLAGAAQIPPSAAPTKSAAVSVGYVLVPVVVTDDKGRAVTGLAEKDFTLVVEGRPVSIDFFAAGDAAPVSFTILLDGSGSMGLAGKMEGAQAALAALVAQARPGDDFSLHVFAEGAVRELVPFTADGSRIVRAAAGVKPWGKTAFFDALARMPDRTLLGGNGSRAILLLTDGLDNASVLTRDGLAELLQGVDVPVYPIGLRTGSGTPGEGGAGERDVDVRLLGRIAFETGGRLSVTDDVKDLPAAIQAIGKDLRAQYLLGFTPTGSGPVKYRDLSIVVGWRIGAIRTRSGYRGTEPPWQDAQSGKKGSRK